MNNGGYSKSTIHDVAMSAGVSVGTVSRVLNGYTNISPENHERVQKAIADLRYQNHRALAAVGRHGAPRRNARARSGTGNICLLLTGMSGGWSNHPLIATYVFGVEEACRERGFHSLSELWSEGQPLPQCIREGKVDGLLIKASRRLPSFLREIGEALPFVVIGQPDPVVTLSRVAMDNVGGGWLVADYLWRCGHRRIAFLCPDPAHPVFLARRQGYESFLRERGAYDPELVVLGGFLPGTDDPGVEPPAMDGLLGRVLEGRGRDATAFVVSNDWIARGLYVSLARRGLRVPDDVSVVGFDNDISLCVAMTPPLTSCDMRFSEVTRIASVELIDRIEELRESRSFRPRQTHAGHDTSGTTRLVPPRLVERASVRLMDEA